MPPGTDTEWHLKWTVRRPDDGWRGWPKRLRLFLRVKR